MHFYKSSIVIYIILFYIDRIYVFKHHIIHILQNVFKNMHIFMSFVTLSIRLEFFFFKKKKKQCSLNDFYRWRSQVEWEEISKDHW